MIFKPQETEITENINIGRRGLLRGGVAAGLLSGTGLATLTACGGGNPWQPKRTVRKSQTL